MMKNWIAFLAVLALMLSLTACGGGEETTVSGMVVAVDGTVITLMEMDGGFGPGGQPPEGERPGMEGFEGMGETTTLDIADAHISVEIDGGKESGSMENIVPGTMVTVTVSPKGQATYVLVNQGFGGFGGINFPAMK